MRERQIVSCTYVFPSLHPFNTYALVNLITSPLMHHDYQHQLLLRLYGLDQ